MIRRYRGSVWFAVSLSATLAVGSAAAQQPVAAQAALPITLVVLDKHCAQVVQPYKLTDNVGELLKRSISRGVKNAMTFLRNKLDGGGAQQPQVDDIPPEMRLEAKRMNWLPMQTEVMYGERAHAQETNLLERESKLGKKHYPVADAMLADILGKVGEEHEYRFQLFILKNSTRNAVARPGGFLYLDQGLVDNPKHHAKARFALAHEIGHVLQRHETRELQGMIVDSYSAKDDMQKAIANARNDPGAVLANVKVGKEIYARHHADQELQADSCGARLLSRVHATPADLSKDLDAFIKDLPAVEPSPAPAPSGKAPAVEQLAAAAHDIVATPAARHPNTAERAQNLQTIFAELTTAMAAN